MLAKKLTDLGDLVCVVLGCSHPLIFRLHRPGHFTLVGPCFVYGLMDGEALLGVLHHPWKIQYVLGGKPRFFNTVTSQISADDPRLGPLPQEWEEMGIPLVRDDPMFCRFFKNCVTRETINWDPRMSLNSLKQQGADLRCFRLV